MGKVRFIGESIRPDHSSISTGRAVAGEPMMPWRFHWRKRDIEVVRVEKEWKDTAACRHGSGERYVSRHWYEILTMDGERMTIYFERRGKGISRGNRWRLYSVDEAAPETD